MRAGTATVCSIERSPAGGRAFEAPERRETNVRFVTAANEVTK